MIDFDGPVDLWHFYLLRSVGKGAFGKVSCFVQVLAKLRIIDRTRLRIRFELYSTSRRKRFTLSSISTRLGCELTRLPQIEIEKKTKRWVKFRSKQRAVNNIIQERRLLEEIESPFVCNLRFAFQDDENLFMILDLMLGGDLRFHLDRLGGLKEEVVKFYVAEMALALQDLHNAGIVHRCVEFRLLLNRN